MSGSAPVVLITGAVRGIGRAAATALVARGARVIVGGRGESRVRAVAEALGGAADWVDLDLRDEALITAAAKSVEVRHGRLDVLVNNAAILLDHHAPLREMTPELLRETLETNVVGTWRVTRAFLPLLERSTDPRIINVSSGAGQLQGHPQAYAPAYSVSKTALNMLTQQMTAALPRYAVNALSPGWCRTEMGGEEAERSAEEGAEGMVWLALDAPSTLRGAFLKDRRHIPW